MSSCSYNCLEQPDTLTPYTDITGIGVVIGYVGSAGIVVSILIIYYFTTHDPAKDPFRKEDGTGPSARPVLFRPNPFDVCLLSLKDRLKKVLARYRRAPSNGPAGPRNIRLETAYMKCVLFMSDLQILTGISILISGFVQLRCGISCFHWQFLTYLAWFSGLTHLTCLTCLRNYLYLHQAERAWRLVAMGIFVLMLLVAIFPTGNYSWHGSFSDHLDVDPPGTMPMPEMYAVCFLGPSKTTDPRSFATMIVTFLFVLVGFLSRVVRLHKSLSIDIVGRARQAASKKLRSWLQKVYLWSDIENSPNGCRRLFVYRPLLALFLTLRILLDAWASMFVEVFWLVTAFVWGLLKLLGAVLLYPQGDNDWTFGQVVPVVLLVAPLLTIAEYMYPEDSGKGKPVTSQDGAAFSPSNLTTSSAGTVPYHTTPSIPNTSAPNSPVMLTSAMGAPASNNFLSNASAAGQSAPHTSVGANFLPNAQPRVQTLQIANATHFTPRDRVRDDPDYNFFDESHWYKTFVVFVSIDIMLTAAQIISYYATSNVKLVIELDPLSNYKASYTALNRWQPSGQLLTLVLYVLYALLIETVRNHPSAWTTPKRKNLFARILIGLLSIGLLIIQVQTMYTLQASFMMWAYLGLYPCCAIAYATFG